MAKFEKGKSGNPAGKPAGTLSKDTARFKEALNGLLEHCADDMIVWLEEISDPKQRFDVLKDFAEYIYPKLARTESQLLGKDGQPADQPQNITNLILSKISTSELELAIEQSKNQHND